jgi:tRNA A-37 threonylcarbamoyl transferase component Bud32
MRTAICPQPGTLQARRDTQAGAAAGPRANGSFRGPVIARSLPLPILRIVKTIGRYEIEREIGRGAMGVVYLARDPHLHRQVAVKTYSLPEGISEELAKQFHERFLREARAAASLSHPGIVTVYDAGEDPARDLPYIAMEFVPGQSLKQRLENGGRLEPAWVIAFGAILADALHVAHRAGIVHRDIKPANILIREGDGAAKIADFGVARLKASDLTQAGASLGSPGYMSPEQIRGGALDGRSDLFSLAVVLYEALCGKRPFHGDDLVSLAYSIAHDTQVPLARQLQGCPTGLDRFFDRALSKDPGKRFPDGAAFRQAFLDAGKEPPAARLDATVVDAATMAPPAATTRVVHAGLDTTPAVSVLGPARGRRGRFFGLAAVALVSVGLAAAAYLWSSRPLTLKANDRGETRAPRPAAVGSSRPDSSQEAALRHVDPLPQEKPRPREQAESQEAERPQSKASHLRQAGPRKEVARTDIESVPQTPRIPRNIQVTVPPGTEIHLALDAPVGSASSHAGDSFTARITDPVVAGDRVAIPAGSSVHGRVSEAIPAKKGFGDKAGSLSLSFDRVATPVGTNAPMSAALTRVAPKSGKKTAAIIGGSAAGGALLGKILGKSTKDAAVASIVGGAIGTGVAAGTKGEDVELPAGSVLTVRLDQPLTISINP